MVDARRARLSRRAVLAGTAGAALPALFGARALAAPSSYDATWASIDQHPPAPEWFQDAKFGIWFHWGAFSVPAFDSEWYPRNMYLGNQAANAHHRQVYGDPAAWPYHNFIVGGRDKAGNAVQFAPKLVSAGGRFDPDEWARLFAAAGAKIAGQVCEHHDGYSMWDSAVNEWNSVRLGPKLNLMQLFSTAFRARGMRYMAALHHAYNFTGYFEAAPRQSDPSLQKLYGQLPWAQQNQLWFDKIKEVVDQSRPDILYQDFNLKAVDEGQRLRAMAYYYNQALSWGREVVATYKDGYNDRGEVFDYERGGPSDLRVPYWMTDDCISSSSWCYTVGIGFYSTAALLHALIDRVSKGGNMMLNIAPMADGSIPADQRAILTGIGEYLTRNGEAVYATRPWVVYGEGPTQMGGGSFTEPRPGTPQDVRYTRDKAGTVLYATILGWPGTTATLTTLAAGRIDLSTLAKVELLGATPGSTIDLPTRTQDGAGLRVTLPARPYTAVAYVLKLSFTGAIPTPGSTPGGPTPGTNYRLQNVTSGLLLDSGGSTAGGSPVKQWASDPSPNLQWRFVDVGGGYHQIINRANGMAVDGWGYTDPGAAVRQNPPNGSPHQHWRIDHPAGTGYRIVNRTTGLALDGGGATNSGAPAKQWPWTDSTNLRWNLVPV